MGSDDEKSSSPARNLCHTLGRSCSKKKKRCIPSRSTSRATQSMQLPPRFSTEDDSQTDVCAATEGTPFNMNQSFFQILTATTTRMSSRFGDEDSDDEGSPHSEPMTPTAEAVGETEASADERSVDRGSGLFRLDSIEESRKGKERDNHDADSNEEDTSPLTRVVSNSSAPYMSQILQAQAQMNSANFAVAAQLQEAEMFGDSEDELKDHPDLAKRLMEIFNLPETEEVISEYPCWLLKSVLLQGYMYITARHICFYAYLPRKDNVVLKSGHLAKRGKSNVKYNRYWFILKGDVLSYYTNPSDLYFLNGNIDLRYGVQASLVEGKGKEGTVTFFVTTDQRKYYFKADSVASAKEWVKALQKVIFRSHNEGDSVKISIPVGNVIEVEESPVLEFADTFKLKVVDNDDTYAIDEYFFSFFSFGKDALNVLRSVVEDSPASKIPKEVFTGSAPGSPKLSASPATTPVLREYIRDTLSPRSPTGSGRASPRPSGEFSRPSIDSGRRSPDISQEPLGRSGSSTGHSMELNRRARASSASQPTSPNRPFSESIVQSFGESSDTIRLSSDEERGTSASNILDRSDVFRSPTLKKQGRSGAPRRSSSTRGARTCSPRPRLRLSTRKKALGSTTGSDSDTEATRKASPSLQDIAKSGSFPLQRAADWADWMKKRSKKVGVMIAAQPMSYLEKVSDMWVGGRRHYGGGAMGMMPNEEVEDLDDDDETQHEERFRARFSLPSTERLQAVYFGYLHRVLPLYGKIYLSNRNFCFRSLLPGTKTKMILPLKDIENVGKEEGFRFGYSGLVVTIRGHEELFFEFGNVETRDDCAITLLQGLDDLRVLQQSGILTLEEKEGAELAKQEHQMLQDARQVGHNIHDTQLPTATGEAHCPLNAPPIVFDDPHGSIINFKPAEPMRITCLTIGSRGDVQPFIALCKGFMAEGHKTKIATHLEFKDWIESFGIEFAPVDGNPAELMAICVEYGMFTVDFMKHATSTMRGWLDGLLLSSWTACQGSDLLIESPSAMSGIHIAEALGIPYFRAFTMPWTRTRAYPHAFAVPEHKMGGAYNYFTYVIIDNVFWKSTAGQINRWRKNHLGLPSTSLDKLQPNKVPFLYNFSPSVVIPPLDYSDWIRVTGYWFLDSKSDWTPPVELADFIRKAREDGKKLVYVGFGSITVADPYAMTRTVVESVLKADVRCILSKGWSDRLSRGKSAEEPEVPIPPEIHQIQSAPHDWLFKQIDAAAHHGGAGTTGASLRAGIPTIVKPFFGDQFFFGNRVEDLGVGICVKKLNTSAFSKALWEATHNERMENGVETAIQAIYRDMEYARTLIKKHTTDTHDESEESWTFVGDDSDPEQPYR
ncbi:Glycosyltransferase Family 1 protein [Tuber magnatum]|uniref:Sterol 3-beta-glucosyltransferase n=1 Tax=Tuber magnatum TaxID=42249 RepID=A0A317SES1_9PEZI|nr:Glycosyltransferase Family 1 protein [Tuber magnatum]